MVLDPTNAWVVTRDGEITHIRMTKGIAEACANIERDVYGEAGPGADIKVVPVLVTEIEDVK
jgi:hypothetical protein